MSANAPRVHGKAPRNILIHNCGVIDHRKTWDIVESGLPVLQREVKALLAGS